MILTTLQESAGEIEVDIEAISVHILWTIYDLVMKHAPEVAINLRKAMDEKNKPQPPAKPAPKKKNKPMNKFEQEQKIEQLKSRVQQFERQSSGSQEPVIPSE
jgi:bromodomain-containing factor 1